MCVRTRALADAREQPRARLACTRGYDLARKILQAGVPSLAHPRTRSLTPRPCAGLADIITCVKHTSYYGRLLAEGTGADAAAGGGGLVVVKTHTAIVVAT